MAWRQIVTEEVELLLDDPASIAPGNEPDTLCYDGVVGGRGLRAVVADGSDPLRIITVMWRRLPNG